MPVILFVLGGLLAWAGWDAWKNLIPRGHITDREISNVVLGEGSKGLTRFTDRSARTRWLVQPDSMAQLVALLFMVLGIGLVLLSVSLLVL